jgi:hypothetical protein
VGEGHLQRACLLDLTPRSLSNARVSCGQRRAGFTPNEAESLANALPERQQRRQLAIASTACQRYNSLISFRAVLVLRARVSASNDSGGV